MKVRDKVTFRKSDKDSTIMVGDVIKKLGKIIYIETIMDGDRQIVIRAEEEIQKI